MHEKKLPCSFEPLSTIFHDDFQALLSVPGGGFNPFVKLNSSFPSLFYIKKYLKPGIFHSFRGNPPPRELGKYFGYSGVPGGKHV